MRSVNTIDNIDRDESGQQVNIMEFDDIKEEMENFKGENQLLKDDLAKSNDEVIKLKDEVNNLQIALQKSDLQRTNMKNKLTEIFSSGQIKKLKNGSKRLQWTQADIARSITLYLTSTRINFQKRFCLKRNFHGLHGRKRI